MSRIYKPPVVEHSNGPTHANINGTHHLSNGSITHATTPEPSPKDKQHKSAEIHASNSSSSESSIKGVVSQRVNQFAALSTTTPSQQNSATTTATTSRPTVSITVTEPPGSPSSVATVFSSNRARSNSNSPSYATTNNNQFVTLRTRSNSNVVGTTTTTTTTYNNISNNSTPSPRSSPLSSPNPSPRSSPTAGPGDRYAPVFSATATPATGSLSPTSPTARSAPFQNRASPTAGSGDRYAPVFSATPTPATGSLSPTSSTPTMQTPPTVRSFNTATSQNRTSPTAGSGDRYAPVFSATPTPATGSVSPTPNPISQTPPTGRSFHTAAATASPSTTVTSPTSVRALVNRISPTAGSGDRYAPVFSATPTPPTASLSPTPSPVPSNTSTSVTTPTPAGRPLPTPAQKQSSTNLLSPTAASTPTATATTPTSTPTFTTPTILRTPTPTPTSTPSPSTLRTTSTASPTPATTTTNTTTTATTTRTTSNPTTPRTTTSTQSQFSHNGTSTPAPPPFPIPRKNQYRQHRNFGNPATTNYYRSYGGMRSSYPPKTYNFSKPTNSYDNNGRDSNAANNNSRRNGNTNTRVQQLQKVGETPISSSTSPRESPPPYQRSPRTGSRRVRDIAQQFGSPQAQTSPRSGSTTPTASFPPRQNSRGAINIPTGSTIEQPPTISVSAPTTTSVPREARKATRTQKRPSVREMPAHSHSVDIFFSNNSAFKDRRSRKRTAQTQPLKQRKGADLLRRTQSSYELQSTHYTVSPPLCARPSSAPPRLATPSFTSKRNANATLNIPKIKQMFQSLRSRSNSDGSSNPVVQSSPAMFKSPNVKSPPPPRPPRTGAAIAMLKSVKPFLTASTPTLQRLLPILPTRRGPSPSISTPDTSPRSTSPTRPLSPSSDPAWTYYKQLPVPPPMPKQPRERGNTLRLSQRRLDELPFYTSVQVLGCEVKQDFKTNKPYTLYVIQATTGVVSWTIHRRFSEFVALHTALTKNFPTVKFPKSLPSKKLLGNLASQLVLDRRTQLEAYLRQFIDIKEVCRCRELMSFMKDQSMDVQDITLQYVISQGLDYSLKLLSSAFGRGNIREYATARWEMESDEELQAYLLQLVQALRFEVPSEMSGLPSMLIARGVKNPLLGNFLHWHLMVEKDSKYPIFTKVHEQFKAESLRSEQGLDVLKMLMTQNELMNFLSGATTLLISLNKIRQKKIKKLRKMFNPAGFLHKLTSFPPLRLPIDPSVLVTGIVQDTAYLFKSALSPMLLQFQTTKPDELYTIIFKKGDDLRQDQLITQMIALMDKLLQKSGLDLRLTPYKVLATSRDEGLVQHIPSVSFASALEEGNFDLQKYFVMHHPDPDGEYGFSDDVLDNFVRSCAGYCVITFILGIGDRHLDNVLLTPTGKIFHIDFGYILDSNPPMKFAPPMKLSKEMIDAMGGVNSRHYNKFIELSVTAYNELRRHSELITNLFSLMADSGVKDILSVNDVIPKLQKKFRMDLNDFEASTFLQAIINESVSAVLPQMVESIHRWAQQRRN